MEEKKLFFLLMRCDVFFFNEKTSVFSKRRRKNKAASSQKKWKSTQTPTEKTVAKESQSSQSTTIQKKKKKMMIKKRAHIASTILGLEYEEEENGKVCYLNADAKDKIDFRAYVAQIRDFLLGNVDYFSSTSSTTTIEESIDEGKGGGEKKTRKMKRTNVALAMRCNQSFLAHFLALSEIPSVDFTVLLNSRWSSEEARAAMEHCECEMLIADEFHLNIWSEFDGSMDVSERLTVLKARPFYSCDRGFRERHDIVMKKSWFQKEDERKRKETENATDVIGELFGKVLELVKGTSGEKDEEKDESGGRDDEDEEEVHGSFTLEDVNVVEHYTEEEQEEIEEGGNKEIIKRMVRAEYRDVRNNCCLVFTSGTSGFAPKAAILSHSNLAAAIDSKLYDENGPQYDSEDVYLHCAPLYHVGGLVSGLAAIKADARHVFLESFDARSFLQAIVTAEVTAFIAVPTMLRKLERMCKDAHLIPRPTTISSTVQSNPSTFNSVKKLLVGGGPMHEKDVAFARKIFPNAKIISTYGMTEATSSIAYADLTDIEMTPIGSRTASASDMSLGDNLVVTANSNVNQGKIIEGLSVKIDRLGQENEILIRGETVSKGYYNTPVAHSLHVDDKYNNNGYVRTGDIGEVSKDSNTVRILGRLSNAIKTGGENVSCLEVEQVVEKHELVQESVVYGVPDDVWGEIVTCAVRLKPDVEWAQPTENLNNPDAWEFMKYAEEHMDDNMDGQLSSLKKVNGEMLRHWCLKKQLARFKVPKQWVVVENEFPRNSGGKIDLSQLRREITVGRSSR